MNYYGQTGPINLNPSLNFFLVAIEMGEVGGRRAGGGGEGSRAEGVGIIK